MNTYQVDPQELALKLLFLNFADCDYRLGNEIISNVMVIWISTL